MAERILEANAGASYPLAFGVYRVLEEVGPWQFGRVYVAQATDAEPRVVVQTFEGIRNTAHGVALVEALSELCYAESDPTLARPLGCGIEGNLPYVLHEYVGEARLHDALMEPALDDVPIVGYDAPADTPRSTQWPTMAVTLVAGMLIGLAGGFSAGSLTGVPAAAPPAPPASTPSQGTVFSESRVAARTSSDTTTTRPSLPPRSASPTSPVRAGSLQVESRPSGAEVFLDGRAIGSTPLLLSNVDEGVHRVRIELAGYRDWSTAVNVGAGVRERVGASLE